LNQPRKSGVARALLPVLICCELIGLSVSSEELIPRRSGDQLRVAAPRLHFITGRSLQRLRDGDIVPFDFQLSVAAGSKTNVVQRALERFVVSYPIWEVEKFSVVRPRNFRKSSADLSANAAEAWCLENIFIPVDTLPANQELWARLEVRTSDPREAASDGGESGVSLAALIDLFSRPTRAQQDHWTYESQPFHLSDLKP
jgi:hypothetical protein